jgi:hypothetical protein
MSTQLSEAQRWLFRIVTDPRGLDVAPADAARIRHGGLDAAERLAIYHRAYTARLVECLTDDYPALRHALGEPAFERLCREFIRDVPPPAVTLNTYGAPFTAYCRGRIEAWASFAADLASVEWAIVEAIHAEDTFQITPEDLSDLEGSWDRARFIPNASLRILELDYPVNAFLRAFHAGDAGDAPALPAREPSALAVCRRGPDVYRLPVALCLLPVLRALVSATALGEALGTADPEDEELLASAFRDWIAHGLFARVVI